MNVEKAKEVFTMNYPEINKFIKTHKYLICIDSDGTAMDAMNIKHKQCFGPCFIKEWGLEAHRDLVIKLWNEVNLYSKTRGCNRFITFTEVLKRIENKIIKIDGLEALILWVETAPELSNNCLKEEIQRNPSNILKKALNWSIEVNKEIAKLSAEDNKPFEGVRECLQYAFDKVDISVISSANIGAITEEWSHFDMLKYVGAMTSQEIGTKGQCIAQMLLKGYSTENVLMIGDAFSDLEAAKDNGVFFYPILAEQEKKCWKDLMEFYLKQFYLGNYREYQDKLIEKFHNNFNR